MIAACAAQQPPDMVLLTLCILYIVALLAMCR